MLKHQVIFTQRMTRTPPLTAADVARLSLPGKRVELVRGQLVVREPPSTWHGGIAGNLFFHLSEFARRHELGVVFPQDTGFKIASDPDTVRAPDVAFVARERLERIPHTGYAELAPDLVAEVISPSDTVGDVLTKVGEWLAAGAQLVWLVDPQRLENRVYRADGSFSVLRQEDVLDGEEVLPGFRCPVSKVFGLA